MQQGTSFAWRAWAGRVPIRSVAGCARISPRTRTLRDDPESARAIAGAVDLAFSWLVADPHPETVPLGAGHSSRRPHKSDASECGADARNRDVPNATAAEGRSRSEPASRLRSSRIAPGESCPLARIVQTSARWPNGPVRRVSSPSGPLHPTRIRAASGNKTHRVWLYCASLRPDVVS